jgi:hypothetical protein
MHEISPVVVRGCGQAAFDHAAFVKAGSRGVSAMWLV